MEGAPLPVKRDFRFIGDAVDLRDELPTRKTSNNISANIQSISSSPKVSTTQSESVLDFLSSNQSSTSYPSEESENPNNDIELKKSLRALTSRIEDNSNELYRLIQRIELLERKLERFENRNN